MKADAWPQAAGQQVEGREQQAGLDRDGERALDVAVGVAQMPESEEQC